MAARAPRFPGPAMKAGGTQKRRGPRPRQRRVEDVEGDARARAFQGAALGQRLQRRLGRGVGRKTRKPRDPHARAREEDPPAALAAHVREHALGQMQRAEVVDVKDLAMAGAVPRLLDLGTKAGVVDGRVDPAELRGRRLDGAPHRLGVAHVRAVAEEPPRMRRRQRREPVRLHVQHGDRVSLLQGLRGEIVADALVGARDEEVHACVPPISPKNCAMCRPASVRKRSRVLLRERAGEQPPLRIPGGWGA